MKFPVLIAVIALIYSSLALGKTVVSCKDTRTSDVTIHSVDYVETDQGTLKLIDFNEESMSRVLIAKYDANHACVIESEVEYTIIDEAAGIQ